MRHVPRHLQALQRRCDEARVERLAAGLSLDRHCAGAISDVRGGVCVRCVLGVFSTFLNMTIMTCVSWQSWRLLKGLRE